MHKKRLVVGGIVGVVGLLFAVFGSGKVFATVTCGNPDANTGIITCADSETGAVTYKYSSSASATASVTVTSACTFSRGQNDSGEYSGTLSNGATIPVIGSTFTTTCNDPGGYAIYAVGYSNNTFGNTDLIFNNTPSSPNNIQTNGSGSHWGMSLSTSVSGKPSIETGFSDPDNPHTIPSTYTKIASYNTTTAETNANTGNDELVGQAVTVTYSATASSTQPAGTYTGAVKYTMVHPGTMVSGNYTIIYNANGGTGTMQSETNIPNYESHTLANNTFTAPNGYVFAGWCTVQDTTASGVMQGANPQTTCTGASYANGATLPDSPSTAATANGTLNLYAYWRVPPTMQQFAAGEADITCSAMNVNDILTLLDVRDSQTYTVAKLADQKCWMTKNLNLPGNILLSSDTTDFDSSYALPTDQGWQSDGKLPASSTNGFSNSNYAYIYNSNSETCGNGQPCYSYYSWDVATLGSGRTSTDNNTPYSICPKGWHLPSTSRNGTDSSTDFRALIISYGGSNTIREYDSGTIPTGESIYNLIGPNTIPNFIITGVYENGLFLNGGQRGYYWSSTPNYNTEQALHLYLFPGSGYTIDSGDRNLRLSGYAIRCLTE